ncbi:MAG: D-alanine--D-alanine ligase [Candidatus Latescibacterota bacterium]
MRVAIVHDAVLDSSAPDVKDVLAQADAVEHALRELGHTTHRFSCSLNLAEILNELAAFDTDLVFNLVESLEGSGRLIHLLPFSLDAAGIPYTGTRAEALMLTSNKVMAKRLMSAAGIPTPPWIGPYPLDGKQLPPDITHHGPWIIKSVWEHASIGLDEESLIADMRPELVSSELRSRASKLGGACFAEQYIDGREFNLSLLAARPGPEVLPAAEMIFDGFTSDMPRIVDYRAKWDEDTYAYQHTHRSFDIEPADRLLVDTLKTIAIRCWDHFGLFGYARVDFRVDTDGRPWVLEININPCLSPDAGFTAALTEARLSFTDAIARIIADAPPPITGSSTT